MTRLLATLLVLSGLAAASGCMSDPIETSSVNPNDQLGNAPAYPNRPGIRQPGFER